MILSLPIVLLHVFFKQETADELRISDWSSDVCSSDLINPKTVQKWRQRSPVEDAPMGPKQRRSTVLSQEEEALIVAFRKHTLLPLDEIGRASCRERGCPYV